MASRRQTRLDLDPALVRRARALARKAGKPVVDIARSHTTVSVERAVLRLAGVTGADTDGIPWVNRLVDQVRGDIGLGGGIALPVFHAMAREGIDDLTVLAQKAAAGSIRFDLPDGKARGRRTKGGTQAGRGRHQADRQASHRA